MKNRNRFMTVFAAALTLVVVLCATLPVCALSEDDMTAMTFGSSGNGKLSSGENNGNATINGDTVDISYAEHTNIFGSHYLAKLKFSNKSEYTNASHRYIRVLYSANMPEGASCKLQVVADATGDTITFDKNITDTNGEFVYTDAKILADKDGGHIYRFLIGGHNSFSFTSNDPNCTFKIKEVALYADAREYYSIDFTAMTFEHGGNGAVVAGTDYGEYTRNLEDSTIDITYADSTHYSSINYMVRVKFAEKDDISATHNYLRILYSADMPEGVTATMRFRPEGGSGGTTVFEAVTDTGGKFVFSEAQYVDEASISRLQSGGHNAIIFDTKDENCTYRIKALYFFANAEDANEYECPNGQYGIEINGNDIEANGYQIVIAKDAPPQVNIAANKFASYVETLSGYRPALVTDDSAETDYEILFGRSNRAKSYEYVLGTDDLLNEVEVYGDKYKEFQKYGIKTDGNTLIVTAYMPHHMLDAVENLLESYFYKGNATIPDTIDVSTNDTEVFGYSTELNYYHDTWKKPTNVAIPKVFTDDFDADNGYFMEENNANRFTVKNGALTSSSIGSALTYLTLYETNATFSADFTVSGSYSTSNFGIMLRYNDANAYVKAGYDYAAGKWYIDSRDGQDFYRFRLASAAGTVVKGTTYRISLTVDDTKASLFVNGNEVASTDELTHLSPGRAAFFTEMTGVSVDNAELIMLSGQGKILKNVYHTILPTNDYTEGGTVIERADGKTLTYIPARDAIPYFNSTNDGKSWTKLDTEPIARTGYPNIIRLNNGELLQIYHSGGYIYARFSNNDGKSWYKSSQITPHYYNNDGTTLKAAGGNMNDKIFMSGTTGYIYLAMTYEAPNTGIGLNGHRVFCDFFCSKDGGMTWELMGNTLNMTLNGEDTGLIFGECKMLELADGTIRMYNSYNRYGCIVYSDFDPEAGTFSSELTELTDKNGVPFPCSTSSMQFVRDAYADNASTYYMVWVDNFEHADLNYTRCGLSIAYSEDGAVWTRMGTLWRWESTYATSIAINHVVDPFIQVTPTSVLCGSGISAGILKNDSGDRIVHNGQRQHIYSLPRYTGEVEPDTSATVVDGEEFGTLALGTQLVMIKAESNDATYTFDGVEFIYSANYKAHVAIVSADVTAKYVYENVATENTPAEELSYDGDLNGDGKVTAGDAAIASAMLINPENEDYTDKMRLEADCLDSNDFVTLDDCLAILYKAVGLTYTPAN